MWRHPARAAPKIDTPGESPAMPRIQCTNCGKNFDTPQEHLGGVIVCAACGGRIEPGGQWAAVMNVVGKEAQKWKRPEPEKVVSIPAIEAAVQVAPAVVAESRAVISDLPQVNFGSPL